MTEITEKDRKQPKMAESRNGPEGRSLRARRFIVDSLLWISRCVFASLFSRGDKSPIRGNVINFPGEHR